MICGNEILKKIYCSKCVTFVFHPLKPNHKPYVSFDTQHANTRKKLKLFKMHLRYNNMHINQNQNVDLKLLQVQMMSYHIK